MYLQAFEHGAFDVVKSDTIAPRIIWPWDQPTVLKSALNTRRLVVMQKAVPVAGCGAEASASHHISESLSTLKLYARLTFIGSRKTSCSAISICGRSYTHAQ